MPQRAQAVIEYLVIVAVIIAALAALSQSAGCQTQALMNTVVNHIPVM